MLTVSHLGFLLKRLSLVE